MIDYKTNSKNAPHRLALRLFAGPWCTRVASALSFPPPTRSHLSLERQALPLTTQRHHSGNGMDVCEASSTISGRELPAAVQLHILSFLPPNDRALSGRLACRDAAEGLSGPQHCTASLSQPLPPRAVPWALEAGQQHVRQLPFRHKLQLMCTAAASGSEVNLEIALALLQPSTFSEFLQQHSRPSATRVVARDPGVAAVTAGHPQLLGWLLRRCPGLLCPEHVLAAAARHCDLAGLQAIWELLRSHYGCCNSSGGSGSSSSNCPALSQGVLDAVVGSVTPDAVAKLEWVLSASAAESSCSLSESTAAAAARSGDLGRLRWLRERGCPMDGESRSVLLSALQHADLAVAQWLVDEAGCCVLPAAGSGPEEWDTLVGAALSSSGGLAKQRWLQGRGAPPLDLVRDGSLAVAGWALPVMESGRVEVMQHLLATFALVGPLQQKYADVSSFSVAKSGSIPMAECLRQAGLVFTRTAYRGAAEAGSLAMVRWLACEGGVQVGARAMQLVDILNLTWPRDTAAQSRDLLEAVQLLMRVAKAGGWNLDVAYLWTGEDDDVEDYESPVMVAAGAIERGDPALVEYLVEVERLAPLYCPLDVLKVELAAQSGCEALLEWAVFHLGGSKDHWDWYARSAAKGDLATVTALRRLFVPWGSLDTLARAVQLGCCEQALRWLVQQGVPVGEVEEMEAAVQAAVRDQGLGAEAAAWLRGLAAGGAAAATGEH